MTTPPAAPGAGAGGRLHWAFSRLGKVLGVVVSLVTLIGGPAALFFLIDPSAELFCIGGAGATFSSIQVAPDYGFKQYIRDIDQGQVPAGLGSPIGAELRYSYTLSNLSGHGVRLYMTLQEILRNGDVIAPPGSPPGPNSDNNLQRVIGVPGQPPPVVTASKCSQDSSGLSWIQLPPRHTPHRYRVVLEVYRGAEGDFTDRVGVGESPIFDY